MSRTITSEISRIIRELCDLIDPTTFNKSEFLEKLAEVEDIVDNFLTTVNYGDKITDMKFKAIKSCIDEYVELVKAIKREVYLSNVSGLRELLLDLDSKIRDLFRTVNLIRSDTSSVFKILDDKGYSFGVDELYELDSKINSLSPSAKRVIKALIDSPLKAATVTDLAKRCGMVDEDGRPISDFSRVIEEILSTIPEMVSLDASAGGRSTLLKWRGW